VAPSNDSLAVMGKHMHNSSRRRFLQLIGAGAAGMSFKAFPAAPSVANDTYWSEPRSDFETRRGMYLEYCSSGARPGRNAIFSQIAVLELGKGPVDETIFREAIEYVYSNKDCNDFVVAGFLRILYLYRESPLLSRKLIAEMEECVLRFKYWWDGPGTDDRCYHTENHQIIYHMCELLAGQLFPDRVFENSGKTGRHHIGHALHLIRRWIGFRRKFGFSEWLSNCYFDHDLMAVANLRDFAEAADVRVQAEMMMDVLLFEIALHSYRGVFGSTHGRTYSPMIKGGRGEHTQSIAKLMFGMGTFNEPDSVGSVTLATSGYRCPPIIRKIAADLDRPVLAKERHSINIEDAPKYGLSYDDVEDGQLYWSIQDYIHPNVIDLSRRMSETFGVRKFEKYDDYAKQYAAQIEEHGKIVNPDLCHKALTEVHIQTYRTGDYALSCAQDYRPGRGGYQQHIWQATLGIDAVAFTNHPGSDEEGGRPDFWAGNGVMPRAAQHRNVLVCVHCVPPDNPLPYSHAYFPKKNFDEVVQRDNWIFGRKGDGYIALYSQHKPKPMQDELRAEYSSNIWVCEMGSRTDSGSFSEFVKAVISADISLKNLAVQYDSPSTGKVEFGWDGGLRVAGRPVELHNYERFDNPYCQSAFTSPQVFIKRGQEELRLDFAKSTRVLV
jgi:hypothetical protein